jgi:hypothetical protein
MTIESSAIDDVSNAALVRGEIPCDMSNMSQDLVKGQSEILANSDYGKLNSKLGICWNKAMCKEMRIPEGYQNVAVLIIKWAEKVDQLKSKDEVSRLRPMCPGCEAYTYAENRSKSCQNSSRRVLTTLPRLSSFPPPLNLS